MESGIYRDLENNEDLVVFGGRIGRCINWSEDRNNVLLNFMLTDKQYEVGDVVSKDAYYNSAPQVGFVFNNPQSVDILINDLNMVKDILNGISKEELDSKYSAMTLNKPTGEKE